MNVAFHRPMTVADYLAWAQSQAEGPRTELINGQIVAMSPERAAHNRAKSRVYLALARALAEAKIPGEVFTDGLTVPVDEFTAYEPDALVHCGAPISDNDLKVSDPIIVVEVLSPASAHTDTSAKLIGYFKLPSVRHYLVIDPDARTVTHHSRATGGGINAQTQASGTLRLDPPGLAIEISTLFS